MTLERLIDLCKKYNISNNVILQSDSGWECSETDMDGVYYNKKENKIIFTQKIDKYDYYYEHKEEGWEILEE